MLTMILGISVAMFLIIFVASKQKRDSVRDLLNVIATVIILVSIALGCFTPLQGMEKDAILVNQLQLSQLDEYNEQKVFVWKDISQAYLYKYKGEEDYVYDYAIGNVNVIETKDCISPVLLEYRREPVCGLWTFGMLGEKTEYVFIVPENSVVDKK